MHEQKNGVEVRKLILTRYQTSKSHDLHVSVNTQSVAVFCWQRKEWAFMTRFSYCFLHRFQTQSAPHEKPTKVWKSKRIEHKFICWVSSVVTLWESVAAEKQQRWRESW